jgi:4'-phosphopantetheinyl transferase EntD
VLSDIVPATVVVEETFTDHAEVLLHPAEAAAVARAVDQRRTEFATVRSCARRALGRLGVAPVPLVPGEHGAPSWPAGVVGSMTHCAGYRAAAVARTRSVRTLGIDAEPHERLPRGVLELVSRPAERRRLEQLGQQVPHVWWDRVLFSAKESTYKAWYPLTRQWLGFEDAELALDPVTSTFEVELLTRSSTVDDRPLATLRGRWVIACGLVVTAIVEP